MPKTFHDYESLGFITEGDRFTPFLPEAYSGSSIVTWYSTIENQLQNKLDDQSAARNHENADRLRAFLKTWRENEISGSLNIDELETLKAAAEQQASTKWGLQNYFSSLLSQLRRLIASEEELPRGAGMDQLDPMGGGGIGRSAPPMSPDFGPEKEPSKDLEGAGLEPTPEADLGAEKVMSAAETEAGLPPRKKL